MTIALRGRCVEYDSKARASSGGAAAGLGTSDVRAAAPGPQRRAAVTMRRRRPYVTAVIFASGAMARAHRRSVVAGLSY